MYVFSNDPKFEKKGAYMRLVPAVPVYACVRADRVMFVNAVFENTQSGAAVTNETVITAGGA